MRPDVNISDALTPNPQFGRDPRQKGERNVQWLERQLSGYEGVAIVLVGGRDNLAFRLRVAQAHLRFSFTPSHWSHCFLLLHGTRDGLVYEISLQPARGFGYAGATNAMQESPLKTYDSARRWPNISMIRLDTIDPEKAAEAVKYFAKQRAVLDAVSLLIPWLAFAWGANNAGNPIHDGIGLPSAAMIEAVCNVCQYDISPTTASRSSTPEALWQATKWWYRAPRTIEAASVERAEEELPSDLPRGAFFIDHELGDTNETKWSEVLK